MKILLLTIVLLLSGCTTYKAFNDPYIVWPYGWIDDEEETYEEVNYCSWYA